MDSMELRVGLVRVSWKGGSICSWDFNGKCGVWIYENGVPLKYVDLIFPGSTVAIINIPGPPFD